MSTSGTAGRKLMITIDVEAQPARAERDHIERLIWGKFDGVQSGMAELMNAAERRGVRLTTYFDYAEQYLYGDAMLDVAREIHARGHDLQLHLHPEFLSDDFYRKHGVGRVHNLSTAAKDGAQACAGFLCRAQRDITGTQPLGFRGGGYRFSHALLQSLSEQGVQLDSSYNPSRPTQPVNIGHHKQFQWQGSTFEVPVSNVFAFSSPTSHLEYNFNASALWGKSALDCALRHRRYLDNFYASFGDDAIAVLVLHSWSLLRRNDGGHYQYAGADALERFEALLDCLAGYASIIDTDTALSLMRAGAVGPTQDLALAEALHHAVAPTTVTSAPDSVASSTSRCPICGTPVNEFEDFNGPKRRCKGCGAVERQRALASLYRGAIGRQHPLRGKKVLLIAPSSSEKRLLKELGVHDVNTADIRPDVKPDLLTDVCNMANVADDSFDVVVASYVLTCVRSLDAALSEITRVLKPGGLLLSSDPITPGRTTQEHSDMAVITAWYGQEAYDKYGVGSFRSFGEFDTQALLQRYLSCEAHTMVDVANGSAVTWLVSTKASVPSAVSSAPTRIAHGSPPRTLSTVGCSVCGNDLQRVEAEQNCTGCGSRARLRALVPILTDVLPELGPRGDAVGKPLLGFAMTAAEIKQLSVSFPSRKSVSLFGNYASEHESGVDARDLSRYPDASFCGVFACLLFDYFAEHEQALTECHRVIAVGGVLITHLAPYRLLNGNEAPQQVGSIKARAGSFEYLPDGQALPDVKVGREWFLGAMRRAGFDAHVVAVKDSVPGIVCDWFIGVRRSEAPAAPEVLVGSKPPTTSERWLAGTRELFRTTVPFGHTGQTNVVFDELLIPGGPAITFVEDTHRLGTCPVRREIVVADRQRRELYTSDDNGATFRRRYGGVTFPAPLRHTFTLANGHRILKLDQSRSTYLFDEQDRILGVGETGDWNWAGSQGIGQSPNGTVLFGEYAAFKEGIAMSPLNVWRLKTGSTCWEKVLTLEAAYRPPAGEIRHFHVCTTNPAKPTQWFLASGDKGSHNRLWTSDDDGDSWQELSLEGLCVDGVSKDSVSGAVRLTQINVTAGGEIIWGSDDKLSVGRAVLMSLNLAGDKPSFRHLGWAGPNAVRSVIKLAPDLFMFISESKQPAGEAAECIILDMTTGKRLTLILPNLTGAASTVTDSLGSSSLLDGVAFLPALGAVLTSNRNGILRLRMQSNESVPVSRDFGQPRAASRSERVLEPSAAPLAKGPAPQALEQPYFRCNPLKEHGLKGPTRICFWDQTQKTFVRLCELEAGETLNIALANVSTTFDLKVKIQTRSGKTWVDNIDYKRVEVDAESLQGIRYRYFPRANTKHLIVIFQAMNTTPGYNYLGTLKDIAASRLYIKDDYGEDPTTRSSYYLGARRSFNVSDGVRSLIREALVDLHLQPKDLIMGGSSKGAFAALFHGYGLNAGHIVAGGPQVLLGNFLNSRSPTSNLPPILRYLAGDTSPDSVAWANNVLFEQLATCTRPHPASIIHVGEGEPHYREHVRPLLDRLTALGMAEPKLDLGKYNTHPELDTHFPGFFREAVEKIVNDA